MIYNLLTMYDVRSTFFQTGFDQMIRRTSNAINQQQDQPNNWATSTPHNQR